MNVYEVDIWRSVRHNGNFSHNAIRYALVHALNEERAKKKIKLDKARTWGDKIQIEASDEFIYGIRKTGTVKIKPYYEYSDGRRPRPVCSGRR